MRDQWRLPPCMVPKPFKAPKKGFLHKTQGEFDITAGDPRWYQGFQKYPNVWDEMCKSKAGQRMLFCKELKENGEDARKYNTTVTTANAFKLWKERRILVRPGHNGIPDTHEAKEHMKCFFLPRTGNKVL